jgi:hypothetical protein
VALAYLVIPSLVLGKRTVVFSKFAETTRM